MSFAVEMMSELFLFSLIGLVYAPHIKISEFKLSQSMFFKKVTKWHNWKVGLCPTGLNLNIFNVSILSGI